MSFNSERLDDYNSKSYSNTEYIDYERYKNYKKINIDYTFAANNDVITRGPVFNSFKIVEGKISTAYTNRQEPYTKEPFQKIRVLKEYNRIR